MNGMSDEWVAWICPGERVRVTRFKRLSDSACPVTMEVGWRVTTGKPRSCCPPSEKIPVCLTLDKNAVLKKTSVFAVFLPAMNTFIQEKRLSVRRCQQNG
jgi:hypothetical protein